MTFASKWILNIKINPVESDFYNTTQHTVY